MKRLFVVPSIALLAASQTFAGFGACGKASSGAAVSEKAACGAEKAGDKVCGDVSSRDEKPVAVAEIDTEALKELVKSGACVIVDARSGKWDTGERIPGAVALTSGADPAVVEKALGKKDSLVITYCSNVQCPASHMLAVYLKGLGYDNVIEYPKGIDGWKAAGNAVEKAK